MDKKDTLQGLKKSREPLRLFRRFLSWLAKGAERPEMGRDNCPT